VVSIFDEIAPFDDPDDYDTDGGRLEDPETESCGGEDTSETDLAG
jgi:hypothetical protein